MCVSVCECVGGPCCYIRSTCAQWVGQPKIYDDLPERDSHQLADEWLSSIIAVASYIFPSLFLSFSLSLSLFLSGLCDASITIYRRVSILNIYLSSSFFSTFLFLLLLFFLFSCSPLFLPFFFYFSSFPFSLSLSYLFLPGGLTEVKAGEEFVLAAEKDNKCGIIDPESHRQR